MISDNGDNQWGVTFGRIMFLDKIIRGHPNVTHVRRHDDIIFEIRRMDPSDTLTIACIDKYSASLSEVRRLCDEFGPLNIIFVGGKWNGYTSEAYDFCQERKIGIYNSGEINGALHRRDYWNYVKYDDEGEPDISIKDAS